MDFVSVMKTKAASALKRLVLPEGNEERTIRAARILMDEKLAASVTLLGNIADIREAAMKEGVDLEGIALVHPGIDGSILSKYANEYYELRKNKGMTPEQAKTDITAPLRWGAMMVHLGDADAMVAGAINTTGDVLRAGLSIIGTAPGIKTASFLFCYDRNGPPIRKGRIDDLLRLRGNSRSACRTACRYYGMCGSILP